MSYLKTKINVFLQVESFVIDQEFEEDPQVEAAKFLLSPDEDRSVDSETQARFEVLLQAAGISLLECNYKFSLLVDKI